MQTFVAEPLIDCRQWAKDYLQGKLDKENREEDKRINDVLMGKSKTNISFKDNSCSTQR